MTTLPHLRECLPSRLTRRTFVLVTTALPALAWISTAFAQSKEPIVIGWLHAGSRESFAQVFGAFREEIQALERRCGSQIVTEKRWAEGRANRLPALAQELAAKKPAVIVAATIPAVIAAANAAPTTPIVVASGDPLAAGLVSNLARRAA